MGSTWDPPFSLSAKEKKDLELLYGYFSLVFHFFPLLYVICCILTKSGASIRHFGTCTTPHRRSPWSVSCREQNLPLLDGWSVGVAAVECPAGTPGRVACHTPVRCSWLPVWVCSGAAVAGDAGLQRKPSRCCRGPSVRGSGGSFPVAGIFPWKLFRRLKPEEETHSWEATA